MCERFLCAELLSEVLHLCESAARVSRFFPARNETLTLLERDNYFFIAFFKKTNILGSYRMASSAKKLS